ncbi:HAD-IIA family hydrolase [Halonotius terrestris]|uniref:HAD-IIA family hydrolase n=1 Tax=Halonotius terrestris TaxID=2487750 RepID=A0A8J8PBI7_9EURY|nr:HAD-IIA family hydrolase [Halonotius terrestris]TQQ80036.1 HAD-IIA family hydrolase [Halonotius terrestris]
MAYQGIIFDVDGTVVRDHTPIPGAAAGLDAVAESGLDRVFLSNNPAAVPEAYEDRFADAGFAVDAEEVFTAGTVTTDYLADEHADDDLFVIGEARLKAQFETADLSLTTEPDAADVLVASIDSEFSYETMCDAVVAGEEASDFVGTDPDMVYPQDGPDLPGSGSIIHAVEGVTERGVDVICGKPSELARRTALDYLGVSAEDCLVVGDRLNTDIRLGTDAGMTTVLTMTGITDEATLAESAVEPDYVVDSLGELAGVIDGTAERYDE